jgi:curved DNA-binding protein CbpA
MNFDDFYDALGMERNSSYTQVELNKFHRKAALKNHPDKGGNADAVSATILMTMIVVAPLILQLTCIV